MNYRRRYKYQRETNIYLAIIVGALVVLGAVLFMWR